MKKLHVFPGVCGLDTVITTETNEDEELVLNIQSKCPAVMKLADELKEPLDAYSICFSKPGTGEIYEKASKVLIHGACPTAAGIIKCIEAEAGLALAKDVSFVFE